MVRRILLVCTGNTCRSAMAAPLLEKILGEALGEKAGDFKVSSAGIYASHGSPASREALEVMREEGIDLSSHRARILNREDVEAADLILSMTSAHKNTILSLYPEAAEKTFTLREFLEEEGDIPDPFGRDIGVYRLCAATIKDCLRRVVAKFLKESEKEEEKQD